MTEAEGTSCVMLLLLICTRVNANYWERWLASASQDPDSEQNQQWLYCLFPLWHADGSTHLNSIHYARLPCKTSIYCFQH